MTRPGPITAERLLALERPARYARLRCLGAAALLAALVTAQGAAQTLDRRLEPLRPLLGTTWRGTLSAPDGSKSFVVTRTFEPLETGRAIKLTKTNRDLGGFGEGFIYWDDVTQGLRIVFVESNGVILSGTVTASGSTITVEGTMTWPNPPLNSAVKQSYEIKNTFELLSPTSMRDRWFQNAFGSWRPGHVIEFEAQPGAARTSPTAP